MNETKEALQDEIKSLEKDLDVITDPIEHREVEYIINEFQKLLEKFN